MKILRLVHDEGSNVGNASVIYGTKENEIKSLLEEVGEIQYCEVGEKWVITVEEMPLEEYKNLHEFVGW